MPGLLLAYMYGNVFFCIVYEMCIVIRAPQVALNDLDLYKGETNHTYVRTMRQGWTLQACHMDSVERAVLFD